MSKSWFLEAGFHDKPSPFAQHIDSVLVSSKAHTASTTVNGVN